MKTLTRYLGAAAVGAGIILAVPAMPASAGPQTLCSLHNDRVPESTYGVDTGTYLQPGQSVEITGGGAIWAGVILTGTNGPEGWWGTVAATDYPLPYAREYSLLARANGSWVYIGQHGTVTNTGTTIVPLQLRTNDNNPGNGDGAFTASYTTCSTDGDWVRAGHANGVRTMTTAAGRLYAVTTDDRLWVRDAVRTEINWTSIGQASGVRALAGTNTALYAATTDNRLLVRGLEPFNVAWTPVGHANSVTSMTTLNGMLYAVTSDGRLWDREIVNYDVNWRAIGTANGVRALGASDANLFVATTDNHLWRAFPIPYLISWTHVQRAFNVTGIGSAYGYMFATTSDNHLLYRKILPNE